MTQEIYRIEVYAKNGAHTFVLTSDKVFEEIGRADPESFYNLQDVMAEFNGLDADTLFREFTAHSALEVTVFKTVFNEYDDADGVEVVAEKEVKI